MIDFEKAWQELCHANPEMLQSAKIKLPIESLRLLLLKLYERGASDAIAGPASFGGGLASLVFGRQPTAEQQDGNFSAILTAAAEKLGMKVKVREFSTSSPGELLDKVLAAHRESTRPSDADQSSGNATSPQTPASPVNGSEAAKS